MKTLLPTVLVTVTIGLLTVAPPALSKTPDGKTPAEETVCDVLKGATPGLYGLCVAYCEAHDAELISPDGDPEKLNTPNRRILKNYNKKKRESDPPMPCVLQEEEGCPCWTIDQLSTLPPPSMNFNENIEAACQAEPTVVLENFEFGKDEEPGYQLSVVPFEQCQVINNGYPGGPMTGFSAITAEQTEICTEILVDYASANAIIDPTGPDRWNCFD